MRSDSNRDGSVDVADAVFTLLVLFGGSGPPPCEDAADADDLAVGEPEVNKISGDPLAGQPEPSLTNLRFEENDSTTNITTALHHPVLKGTPENIPTGGATFSIKLTVTDDMDGDDGDVKTSALDFLLKIEAAPPEVAPPMDVSASITVMGDGDAFVTSILILWVTALNQDGERFDVDSEPHFHFFLVKWFKNGTEIPGQNGLTLSGEFAETDIIKAQVIGVSKGGQSAPVDSNEIIILNSAPTAPSAVTITHDRICFGNSTLCLDEVFASLGNSSSELVDVHYQLY